MRETATNAYGHGTAESAATIAVDAKQSTIAGTVQDKKTKAAIAAATVNCTGGYSAKTGSKGNYSIPNVPPGRYTCTAAPAATGHRRKKP